MTEYALYKGDVFITLGTIDEISEETGVAKHLLKHSSFPSYAKRHPNGRKLIKIEVDDEG